MRRAALLVLLFAGVAFADSAQEHYDKGAELVKAKKLPEARKEFEKAVELDPKHVDAQRILAELLRRDGKPETAAKHLEAALEVEPESVKILGELGNAYAEAAQNAAAEEIVSHEKRDKLAAKAIEVYKRLLAKEPDSPAALNNMGAMQCLAEHWADAMATLEQYVAKKPDDRRGLYNFALACDKAGAPPEKALAAWEAFTAAAKGDAAFKKELSFADGRVKALKKKK